MYDDVVALGFLIFSIGVFFLAMNFCRSYQDAQDRREDRQYERRIMEAREFGFDPESRHTVETLSGPRKKK